MRRVFFLFILLLLFGCTSFKDYIYHKNITATVFWIGEDPTQDNLFIDNYQSCFDERWLEHYGGFDNPERLSLFPENFIPKENPFYVALPVSEYYDNGTLREEFVNLSISHLKNLWVEVSYNNKTVYAQLEDCGPFIYDDFDYVFGTSLPKNKLNNNAGIDISPAVANYLLINSSAKVNWRFIDEKNVPPGPWKATVTRSSNCYGYCNYTSSSINWTYLSNYYRGPKHNISKRVNWHWQLQGSLHYYNVSVYDVDLFNTKKETITNLRNNNSYVICYFSAGTAELYRKDYYLFPKNVLGNYLENWKDEIWLDISNFYLFAYIMEKRLDLAILKGCDAVEVDNIDVYLRNSGFNISFNDQLKYNKWLADEAHKRGLDIALKNDFDQADLLFPYFDLAITEDCFYYNECNKLQSFINSNKPILDAEYILTPNLFCNNASNLNISAIYVPLSLNGSRIGCD